MPKPKSEIEKLLASIDKKMDLIAAAIAAKDKDINQQIKVLTNAGFERSEISRILGITPNAITMRKKLAKKNKATAITGDGKK